VVSRDGINGVDTQLFKLRAKPPAPQKMYLLQYITGCPVKKTSHRGNLIALSKFAIRPIFVRRTRIEQAVNPLP
jgi:hypothetical protein